jgi:hypothetical protein
MKTAKFFSFCYTLSLGGFMFKKFLLASLFFIPFVLTQTFSQSPYGRVLTLDNSGTQEWIDIYTVLANYTLYNPPPPVQVWFTNGNAIGSGDFLGTTNNQPLIFKTNNTEQMRVTSSGNVGIGTTTPQNKLDIAGGAVIGAGYSGTNTAPANGLLVEGNVGIGTTTPNNTIQVAGLINFDNSLWNTALGYQTLNSNTTGSFNTASGYQALYSNTVGNYNTANGAGALLLNETGYFNTACGFMALDSNTTGHNNTANGAGALRGNTNGYENTACGAWALKSNITGYSNTACGYGALSSNTTGYENAASGVGALYSNITGHANTACGGGSLYSNTTGYYNTASGTWSLYNNTTGQRNTANGVESLGANISGWYNTASGYQALSTNTTGNQNTALGAFAGYDYNNTGGESGNNTFIGYNTGRGITTGTGNTIIGANVTGLSGTLTNNIIIADGLGNRRINVDANGNVGIGTTDPGQKLSVAGTLGIIETGSSPTYYTIFQGGDQSADITYTLPTTAGSSGQVLTTNGAGVLSWTTPSSGWSLTGNSGTNPTTNFIGTTDNQSLAIRTNNTERIRVTNDGNVGIGTTSPMEKLHVAGRIYQSGLGNSTYLGDQAGANDDLSSNVNTGIGYLALRSSTSGEANTAIGGYALRDNTSGGWNAACGYETLQYNMSGNRNTAIGAWALRWGSSGSDNTATGYGALHMNNGNYNTASGVQALTGNTTASRNVGIGYQALYTQSFNNSGIAWNSDNVAVGYQALYSNQPTSTANGIQNTAIGNFALYSNTTGYYNIAIGYQAGRYIANGVTGNQTGNNSVFIGYNSRANANSETNQIVIGANAVGAGSNSVVLGNDAITKTILKGNVGIGTTDPTATLDINGSTGYNQLRLRTNYTPTGSGDTNGNVGDISWDDNYIYVKTSSGWKRAALSSW